MTALMFSFIGIMLGIGVYSIERTTGNISWLLVLSFPVFFSIAGYVFWRLEMDMDELRRK